MTDGRFRLLTLNTGLFRLRIGPWSFLDPIPHPATRVHHLADAVRSVQPDIIAFQEVYADRDLDRLRSELGAEFPYYISARDYTSFPRIRSHSGLSVFSRFPFSHHAHVSLDEAAIDERPFMGKGFLVADIETPCGTLTLSNMHLTSGGIFRNPRAARMSAVRNGQIDQIAEHLLRRPHALRIMTGDLNAGPDVSPENYQRVLHHGFVDAWDLHPTPDTRTKHVTWEITNPLNNREFHKTDVPQRIDHVFIHPNGLDHVHIERTEVVLHEPTVPTKRGLVTVSDHYGLITDLACIHG
jgi:endonuclease/exonuclease/phosphatase family metal-dependent hydrolase